MSETSGDAAEDGWRSYRCPVCSHSDSVSLAGAETVSIRCSHCGTPLEIRPRGGASVSVTVTEVDGGSDGGSPTEPAG